MDYYGVYIYPNELTEFWLNQILSSGINLVAIHPAGGKAAHEHVNDAINWLNKPSTQDMLSELEKSGVAVEYGMHALSWMLPRTMFDTNPEWFRLNENNNRSPDFNMCASNEDALKFLARRAGELVSIFKPSTGRHHLWQDDVEKFRCHCGGCIKYSTSDYALIIYNAILTGIKAVDPNGRQSYLAYLDTIEPPSQVKPLPGIFLEYAPIRRDLYKPINDIKSDENRSQVKSLRPLIDFFGNDNAQVLDYWLDNSKISNWTMPMKKFYLTPDIIRQDAEFYRSLGFSIITCFACFLGDEYVKLHGDTPDIAGYMKALKNVVNP